MTSQFKKKSGTGEVVGVACSTSGNEEKENNKDREGTFPKEKQNAKNIYNRSPENWRVDTI